MIKREAKFQTYFNQYLRARRDNGDPLYGHFELKQTTGDRIFYRDLKEHQIDGLAAAEAHGFIWKYSDEDSRQKPFDCSSIPPIESFIVLKYPRHFYIIPAILFVFHKSKSNSKSITSEECEKICRFAVQTDI